jgi:hypothetical protein
VGRSGGPRGPPQCGPCPVCALKGEAFSFGFLQVLSRISPVVLGDPQGCPRQKVCKYKSLKNANGNQLIVQNDFVIEKTDFILYLLSLHAV